MLIDSLPEQRSVLVFLGFAVHVLHSWLISFYNNFACTPTMRDYYVWAKESVQGEKWHGIAICRREGIWWRFFWQQRVDSTTYSHVLSSCKKLQFKSRLIPFIPVASLPISCFIFNFYFPCDFKQPWPNNMVDLQIVVHIVRQHMCTSIRSLLTKLPGVNKQNVS